MRGNFMIKIGSHVSYVPRHAKGQVEHPDIEYGVVTGQNEKYIFVRFGSEKISKAVTVDLLREIK
jgi:hypothetical protein